MDQGRHLTVGYLHHIGLLMRIFEDWINTAEHDGKYCQPFIAFDPASNEIMESKTGYVLATKKSADNTFKTDFDDWKKHLTTTFGPTAIHSGRYLQEEALCFKPPPFALPPMDHPQLDTK